jgi:hypothetical protein
VKCSVQYAEKTEGMLVTIAHLENERGLGLGPAIFLT